MVLKKRYKKKWETVDPYHAFDVLGYFPEKDIKYRVLECPVCGKEEPLVKNWKGEPPKGALICSGCGSSIDLE